jgi:hypothetical protein
MIEEHLIQSAAVMSFSRRRLGVHICMYAEVTCIARGRVWQVRCDAACIWDLAFGRKITLWVSSIVISFSLAVRGAV